MKKTTALLALLLLALCSGCMSDNKAWVQVREAELKSQRKAAANTAEKPATVGKTKKEVKK